MSIEQERFVVEGRDVGGWRLCMHGIELRVAGLGGAILSLRVPDRDGRLDDVVLGYADPAAYLANPSYLGVLVGRYGNRIAGARFTIDGTVYRLTKNDGQNHLHGGRRGFSRVAWAGRAGLDDGHAVGIALTHTSVAGDEGYPGEVAARVTYTLTARAQLVIDYHATTDGPTHLTLTQHTYFNLAGHGAGTVLDHELTIDADRFLPVGPGLIPTGELREVEGTPFDFRRPARIGARIDAPEEQLRLGRGYDHCFVLNRSSGAAGPPIVGDYDTPPVAFAARVVEPRSGRTLDVYTSEPGVQLYSGNYLGDGLMAKGGAMYAPRAGFALETQHFPDSPNQPAFPSTLLRPGVSYRSRTIYAFGVT